MLGNIKERIKVLFRLNQKTRDSDSPITNIVDIQEGKRLKSITNYNVAIDRKLELLFTIILAKIELMDIDLEVTHYELVSALTDAQKVVRKNYMHDPSLSNIELYDLTCNCALYILIENKMENKEKGERKLGRIK